MASMSESLPTESRIEGRRLYWAAPLTLIAAVLAAFSVRSVAVTLLTPQPGFWLLGWSVPFGLGLVLVAVLTLALALLLRFAQKPVRSFRITAILTGLVFLVADLTLLFVPVHRPGGNTANPIILAAAIVMQLAAWWVTFTLLTRLTQIKMVKP